MPSTQPIRIKYGGRTDEAARRALRAEIPGADLLLDALRLLQFEITKPRPSITAAQLAETQAFNHARFERKARFARSMFDEASNLL